MARMWRRLGEETYISCPSAAAIQWRTAAPGSVANAVPRRICIMLSPCGRGEKKRRHPRVLIRLLTSFDGSFQAYCRAAKQSELGVISLSSG